MSSLIIEDSAKSRSPSASSTRFLPFILLCTLFFLWAVANNLNDILLPQFQSAFSLNNFEAGLIQSSFYFGYFVVPIPAGIIMNKFGYKAGLLFGLMFYALGAAMFIPAAHLINYSLFLFALFVIAAGLGFLETAANPFVMVLGPNKTQAFRINAAQSCNAFGSIIAVVFGQSLILNSISHKSAQELAQMTSGQVADYKASLVGAVELPYIIVTVVVLVIALAIFATKYPAIHESSDVDDTGQEKIKVKQALSKLIHARNWRWAVISQFCYCGAQTAIWSYMIRYAIEEISVSPSKGANFLTATMVCFFIGRVIGTMLVKHYKEEKVLAAFALGCIVLTGISAATGGMAGLLAIVVSSAFMSIQYPTIFAIGIKGLGTSLYP